MCNEFVYCPRLFHFEHVQGIFVESADTIEGQAQHERAAKRSSTKAKPSSSTGSPGSQQDDTPPWDIPNTLSFIAPQLGVVGKLDTIEADDDEVIVVEAKRGRAPKMQRHTWGEHILDFGAWPADVAQVALYIAMLREHGLPCTQARIYYRKSKTSRIVPWSDALERFIHAVVLQAKQTSELETPPEPLRDSPKCVGCSLHAVCLPDEHYALARLASLSQATTSTASDSPNSPNTSEKAIRRIVPPRDDKSVLHVLSPGTVLRKRGDSLIVCLRSGEQQKVPVKDVSHVAIYGGASLTQPCTAHLLQAGVPISHHTGAGRLLGLTHSVMTLNIGMRRAQFRAADDKALSLDAARAWVTAKITNQRTILRRYRKGAGSLALDDGGEDLPDRPGVDAPQQQLQRHQTRAAVDQALRDTKVALSAARRTDDIDALRGHEGDAAARYFYAMPAIVPPEWKGDFCGRSRRPPRDRINAMLSFGYALLTRDAAAALTRVGLDPMLGLFHTMRPGRVSLALDVIEPFRAAWVDAAMLRLIATGGIRRDHFHVSSAGVVLSDSGRRRVITAYERRADELTTHPHFGYRASIRRLLDLDVRVLGKWLLGEIPALLPFCTR